MRKKVGQHAPHSLPLPGTASSSHTHQPIHHRHQVPVPAVGRLRPRCRGKYAHRQQRGHRPGHSCGQSGRSKGRGERHHPHEGGHSCGQSGRSKGRGERHHPHEGGHNGVHRREVGGRARHVGTRCGGVRCGRRPAQPPQARALRTGTRALEGGGLGFRGRPREGAPTARTNRKCGGSPGGVREKTQLAWLTKVDHHTPTTAPLQNEHNHLHARKF